VRVILADNVSVTATLTDECGYAEMGYTVPSC